MVIQRVIFLSVEQAISLAAGSAETNQIEPFALVC